ncbi:molybdate ABC transporter permease subunit [uncultured Sulfitobacter sp.]|uniref:molybdate ABC transporter permease subunit n=1 Tax=uncultured Sulfitobacter sp. TaxID=191468 RepID=UPI00260E9F5A|nr:molybdate ABC transporter permease subunit [uncultured Sulfitobacter sp.]
MTLDAVAWDALRLSLWVAVWATVIAVPLALWVAWILARWEFRGKSVLNALVHLPLVLPPVVTGYVLLVLFSPSAPAGAALATIGLTLAFKWTGAVLAAIVMGFPLMVRAMRLAIEAVDPKLEEAAGTLGAARAQVFARVTLPLIAPGILAGAVMGFAKAMGEFGATITFVANIPGQTQTLPIAIWTALQIPGGEGAAAAMALLSCAVAFGAIFASEALARRVATRIGGAQ